MIILIDQDETIADFIGGFTESWAAAYPDKPVFPIERYSSSRVADHYPEGLNDLARSIYTSPGFILGLKPIEGAIQAVKEMVASGHEVRICTSPLSAYDNCVTEKYLWVERNFGRDFTKRIIMTKDKTLIRGDILIDDSVPKGILPPSFRHIIFDRPYNRSLPGARLCGWDSWRDIVL